MTTLDVVSKELEELKLENKRLHELLKEKVVGENQRSFSDEETICVVQIRLLRHIAEMRPMTLEEARVLDIFVKNLTLIRGDIVEIPKEKKSKKMSNVKLLELASKV